MSTGNIQSHREQTNQNANKPHKKPAATINKEDKKRLWNELAIYCKSLMNEEANSKPGQKFNHPDAVIEIFVKLGLRAPNNYKGLNKFYDNFIRRCNFVPENDNKRRKKRPKNKKKNHQSSRSMGFGQRMSNNAPQRRYGGHGYGKSAQYDTNKQQLRDNLPAPKAPSTNGGHFGQNHVNMNGNMVFHQQQQQQQQQQLSQRHQFQQYGGVVNVTTNVNQMNYMSSIGQLNNMNMNVNNFNLNVKAQQMNNVQRSINHQQMNNMLQPQQPQQSQSVVPNQVQMAQNGQLLATIQIPLNAQISAQEVFAMYQQQVMQMQRQQQMTQQRQLQQAQQAQIAQVQQQQQQQQVLYNSTNGQVLFPSNQSPSHFNNHSQSTSMHSVSPQFPSMFSSQNQANNVNANNSSNSQYMASHKNSRSHASHSLNQESLSLSNHHSGHSMSMSMSMRSAQSGGLMAPVLSDDYSGHTDASHMSQHSKNSEIIPRGLPHKASKRYSSKSKHITSQSLNFDNNHNNNNNNNNNGTNINRQSMHIQSNSYSPYNSVSMLSSAANSSSSVSNLSSSNLNASPYRPMAVPQNFGLQTVPESNDNLNVLSTPYNMQRPAVKIPTTHSVQSSNASSYMSNLGHSVQHSSISDASSLNAPSPDDATSSLQIENGQSRDIMHQRTATPINERLKILGNNNRRLHNHSFDIATNNAIRTELLNVQNGLYSIQSNASGWSVNSASNISTSGHDYFTLGFVNTDGKYVRVLFEYLQKEADDMALFLDLNAVPSRTASIASNSLRPFGGSLSAKSSRNISNQSSFNPFVGALSNKLSLGRSLIPNLSNLSNTSSYKPFGGYGANSNSLNDKRSNTLSLKPLHQSNESAQVEALPMIPSSGPGPSHAVADSTDYETIKDMVYVHPISDSIDVGNLAICKEVGIDVPKMNFDAITESESESTTKDSLLSVAASAESNKQPKGSAILSPVASVKSYVGSIHGSIAAPHNDLDGLVMFEPVKPFELLDLYRMRNKNAPFVQFKVQFEGILQKSYSGCVKYLSHRIKHTISHIQFVRFVIYALPEPSHDVHSIWYELCDLRQDYVCRAVEECRHLIVDCKADMIFSTCIVPIHPKSFSDDEKECARYSDSSTYKLYDYERTKSSVPFLSKQQLSATLSEDIKNCKKKSESTPKAT